MREPRKPWSAQVTSVVREPYPSFAATRLRGHLDEDGRLVVTGRIDDIILSGGEKVVPQHVEAVLESFPTIRRAVVLGVADDDWGQAAVAVIEGDPVDEAALGARARAALPTHEVPKRWVSVEALPLLPNGKIDRAACFFASVNP